MAPRDQTPVHVPLRTSSRNLRSDAMNQEDTTFADRRTSKAQRILGTDLPIHNQAQIESQKHSKSRRSSLRTPDSNTRQSTGFVPFPNAITSERMIPPQNLRVRASSPLLGHEYLSHDPTPPLPKPSKRIHQSGSSSTLFSYFTSKESKSNSPQGLQPRVSGKLGMDPHVTFKQSQSPPKESKRKMRPPRIDLSILFPKPRNQAPPLLSPQRMTSSPSPVSTVVSDYPTIPTQSRDRTSKTSKTSTSTARRFGDPLPVRSSMVHEAPKSHMDRSDLLSIPESKDSDFLDRPFERTVGTSEIDLALDRYAARRSLLSHSSMYTASREQLQTDQRRPSETSSTTRRGQSPADIQRQSRDVYLSPKSKPQPASQITSPPEQNWRQKDRRSSQGTKGSVTKKSSKSTLQNKDLQNTSVLCLSSSDDETEDEKPTPTDRLPKKNFRDSVATYDEFDAEIYTASTAHAATAQMLRKVDRSSSIGSSSRGSQKMPQRQLSRQHASNPSMSSTSKSSTTTRRTTQSRRSSGVPVISEPDILEQLPQPPRRTPRELKELKEMNRRSRVIAVTRQEQDLLEAMRQRKGKITPSIFNYNTATEPDRNSVLSVPSRDSFCGSDTSFLRLSAAFPPFPQRSDQGASHKHKSGSPSQSSSSDLEQKTGDSGYSESLPSPSTGASPLTPTLPIHRFSPLPSPKPPPRGPPPAIPEDQKQHTRRRTDSSEAIMLNDEPPRKHDLPLWSFDFDWNHDRTSVAAVH